MKNVNIDKVAFCIGVALRYIGWVSVQCVIGVVLALMAGGMFLLLDKICCLI